MHAHLLFITTHAKPRKRAFHEKRRNAASSSREIGLCKDDVDARNVAVRNPNLRSVQDVVVPVTHCARLNSTCVGTGLWFRQAKSADDLTARQSRKVLLLLRVSSVL